MHRFLFLTLLCMSACGDKDDSGPGETALEWFTTCGDPVCKGYTGPTEGLALCTDEGVTEGGTCEAAGAACDLEDDCNRQLLCAGEDPKGEPEMCPSSVRSTKTDIAYLGAAELDAARDALLDVKLARWRYSWDSPETERLGFIIDDGPAAVAIQPDGRHVNVYGYASLAVAAAQAQQSQIDQQAARLAAQEAELAALREELAALRAALSGP